MSAEVKRSYRRKRTNRCKVLEREDAVEEVETEEGILEGMRMSKELVERVKGFGGEKELLEWMLEEQPSVLALGRKGSGGDYLVEEVLREKWRGLGNKLEVHGWSDRKERLEYLWEVLGKQWENKKGAFKIVTQFLMLMAERPTAVNNLEVNNELCYKMEVEPEEDFEEDESEKEKQLLLEILGEEVTEMEEFSEGDSLSEWSEVSSEEEDISAKSGNSLPPIIKPVRTSSSFGEFKDILKDREEDPERKLKEAEAFWRGKQQESREWLEDNLRTFETEGLTSQPVISSRLVLQARFGEFWEWKMMRGQEGKEVRLEVAFTEDVIREILWQFAISQPKMSPVFRGDWSVRENLMVASLSKVTFDRFVNKFGRVLGKLQNLRNFSSQILGSCHPPPSSGPSHAPPSKVYGCYASGLEEISIFIMDHVNHLEQEIKRLPRPPRDKDSKGPAVTTFLQLELQTQSICEMIETCYRVHSQAIINPLRVPQEVGGGDASSVESLEPWQATLKLLACLEFHLAQEIRPQSHGLLLFLWTQCLHATLDELLCSLKTLKWNPRYSLFLRDTTVQLNDINFWSDCIKIRDITENCSEFGGNSLQSLQKLLPKILSILKTCEVFDQLEEDFTQILGAAANISAELLINSFLKEVLPQKAEPPSSEDTQNPPDFFAHFNALGLHDSQAINCFRFLQNPKYTQSYRNTGKVSNKPFTFKDFWNLRKLPVKTYNHLLDTVFSLHFDPFCNSAKLKIQKIFQDYRVLERMTTFQEIILTVREDFARGIIRISSRAASPPKKKGDKKLSEFTFEEAFSRNTEFQKLLNDCYPPDCRGDTFSIDLKLDPGSDMQCTFEVTPKFPLNLIVTPQSVAGYLYIGRQLHRIRKALWNVLSLSLKQCCNAEGGGGLGDAHGIKCRMMILRFHLINFCGSLRSFFMLKVFSRDFAEFTEGQVDSSDLDVMRGLHEKYLDGIQTKMLRDRMVEGVLIPQIGILSESLRTHWSTGLPLAKMIAQEETLKKCWQVVKSFEGTMYSPDFHELSWHFGAPPSYITS